MTTTSTTSRPGASAPPGPPLPRWATSVAIFVLVTAALVFVAWAKMETLQITYAIDELIDEEAALAEEQRRLRAELAELRSPRKLELLAPELGLVPPEPGQVVVIAPEVADDEPGPASDDAPPAPVRGDRR